MPYERSSDYAHQFGPYLHGIPTRQKVTRLTPLQVSDLVATPVTVLSSEEVKAGFCAIPFRVVVYKPAGEAYTVPADSALHFQWIGISSQLLFHVELDPAVLGTNLGLDQAGEYAGVASGPSFDWTGAAQMLTTINPAVDANGKGLEVVNPAASDITAAEVPLTLWVWYQELPVRVF